jgi:ubiquitin-conjugating enzyme E2 Z
MAAVKRAVADIKELQNPLYSQTGIYYKVSDSNVLKGTACIFGPKGTPYEDCPMLFEIQVSTTYPFDPPTVRFLTYDGQTRFHPNMYVDGKVCLSILHTWQGPKWASTMRLSTILVTLQSLMDEAPLRHEPGYESGHEDVTANYSKYVEAMCIKYTLDRLACTFHTIGQPLLFEPFEDEWKERIPGILERLEKRLEKLVTEGEKTYLALPYKMQGKTTYAKFLDLVVKLKTLPISTDK